MDAEKRRLRDEVAKLSDAVHDLRGDLAEERRARGAHYCGSYGCHCGHVCIRPAYVYPNAVYPNVCQAPVTVSWGAAFQSTAAIPGCAGGDSVYTVNTTTCASPTAQLI
jgi:hypothetical protein